MFEGKNYLRVYVEKAMSQFEKRYDISECDREYQSNYLDSMQEGTVVKPLTVDQLPPPLPKKPVAPEVKSVEKSTTPPPLLPKPKLRNRSNTPPHIPPRPEAQVVARSGLPPRRPPPPPPRPEGQVVASVAKSTTPPALPARPPVRTPPPLPPRREATEVAAMNGDGTVESDNRASSLVRQRRTSTDKPKPQAGKAKSPIEELEAIFAKRNAAANRKSTNTGRARCDSTSSRMSASSAA